MDAPFLVGHTSAPRALQCTSRARDALTNLFLETPASTDFLQNIVTKTVGVYDTTLPLSLRALETLHGLVTLEANNGQFHATFDDTTALCGRIGADHLVIVPDIVTPTDDVDALVAACPRLFLTHLDHHFDAWSKGHHRVAWWAVDRHAPFPKHLDFFHLLYDCMQTLMPALDVISFAPMDVQHNRLSWPDLAIQVTQHDPFAPEMDKPTSCALQQALIALFPSHLPPGLFLTNPAWEEPILSIHAPTQSKTVSAHTRLFLLSHLRAHLPGV